MSRILGPYDPAMIGAPSTNGRVGRNGAGRFTKGNPGGPGNPHAARVAAWRWALARTVTAKDLRAVVRVLVERAKAGEPWAIRELLDRCLGKPVPAPDCTLDEPQRCIIKIVDERPDNRPIEYDSTTRAAG